MMRRSYLLLTVLLIPYTSFSQTKDFGSWNGIDLEKTFSEHIRVNVDLQTRLYNNLANLNSSFADMGFTYLLSNNIRFSGNYRYISRTDRGNRHRIYFDATIRSDITDQIRLYYRLRYQNQFERNSYAENYLRNKFRIRYGDADSRIKPFIATEIYYHFKNDIIYEDNTVTVLNEFTRYRIVSGINISINENNSIDLFYLYQKEYNVNNPEIDNIIGLVYSISF